MAGLRTSLQGRASLGALVSLGHIPIQGGGVPANALTLNGQPITLNGQYITLTKAA